MAIAGTLAVNIIAKTDKFKKGVGGARKGLKGFRAETGLAGKALTAFSGMLAGAVGVGSILAFTRSTLQSVDSLAKISAKLGTSTEELGKWRFAAGLAGVQTTQLDTAFQRMVRRLGQAAQGTGEAVKVLNRFNLDAKELIKLDPGEQFRIIGENINSITNQNEKLAAAMALFDTEGVGLVNLFASNLGEAADNFERFGLAVDSTKAKKVEELNQSLSQLAQASKALGRNVLLDIAPSALEWLREFQNLVNNDTFRRLVKFASGFGFIPQALKGFRASEGVTTRRSGFGRAPLNEALVRKSRVPQPGGRRISLSNAELDAMIAERRENLNIRHDQALRAAEQRRQADFAAEVSRLRNPAGRRVLNDFRRVSGADGRSPLAGRSRRAFVEQNRTQRQQLRQAEMQTRLQQATLDALRRAQQQPGVSLEPATF